MDAVCDFCSSPDVVKAYGCESFTAFDIENQMKDRLVGTSEGMWAACQECADLIDGEKWDFLAQRSLETCPQYVLWGQRQREEMLEFIKQMHQQFKEKRLKVN